MKTDLWRKWILAALCAVVALGMVGCDDDDDDDAPGSIAGTWAMTISGVYNGSPFTYSETMTIVQNGTAVSGSYTYDGETYTFTGTYSNGRFTGVDSYGWSMNFTFGSANSGGGQMTGTYSQTGQAGTETVTLRR